MVVVEVGEDELKIEDFFGSVECFEICVKFCYGVMVIINVYNVGEVWCGVEFLKMMEIVEKSNFIYKFEFFLNIFIVWGWKDLIICF